MGQKVYNDVSQDHGQSHLRNYHLKNNIKCLIKIERLSRSEECRLILIDCAILLGQRPDLDAVASTTTVALVFPIDYDVQTNLVSSRLCEFEVLS